MNVLMVGVDESTMGGMWTVVENYLNDESFVSKNNLVYIPTSITECPIPRKVLFTIGAYLKIIQLYKKTSFDILHVHMSERASIKRKQIVMKFAKKKGTKIVLHMHGAEFEVLYNQMSERKKAFVRETLDLTDKILILGEYWNDFIGSLVKNPKKIQVVYNAVKVPNKYKYDINNKSILFLGAVSKRKGINILIEALKENSDTLRNECSVNIYGPDVEGNIEQLINNAGLNTWVMYKGWLDKSLKSKILENTAINVLPSYNEGLPMTILEAMSYGIPSITTSVAAIPEVVNSNNGVIIEPGDIDALGKSILELLKDNDYRLALSEQAYCDAVDKFSIEKHNARIQTIYEELNI